MIPTLRECINNYDLNMLETFMANGLFSNMSRSGPFILLIPQLTKYFYTFYTHKKKKNRSENTTRTTHSVFVSLQKRFGWL